MKVLKSPPDLLLLLLLLHRFISWTSTEKELPKYLADKILYIVNVDGRQRIAEMYKKRASEEEILALNAVAKH